jgi:hypothetical protein
MFYVSGAEINALNTDEKQAGPDIIEQVFAIVKRAVSSAGRRPPALPRS